MFRSEDAEGMWIEREEDAPAVGGERSLPNLLEHLPVAAMHTVESPHRHYGPAVLWYSGWQRRVEGLAHHFAAGKTFRGRSRSPSSSATATKTRSMSTATGPSIGGPSAALSATTTA